MSLLGMTSTITATRTLSAPMELASPSNVAADTTLTARLATATRPTTGAGRLVISAPLNYMVVQTLNTAGATSVTWYAIGWTFSSSTALWTPKLISKFTVTPSTTSGADISSLRPGRDYLKSIGDMKVYNGEETSCPGGFIVLDVVGSELVELRCTTAAAGNINALIANI